LPPTDCIAGDLADAAAIDRAIAETVATFGALHVLVVSSGGPPPGAFLSVDEDAWRVAIDGTLLSMVRLIRGALPHMQRAQFGRIIVITSSSVREPIAGLALSNALRPGIAGLCKTIAREVAKDGITVNNVAPGSFDTDRIAHVYEANAKRTGKSIEESRADLTTQIPVGRLGDPVELGDVVAFLSSAQASYLTGQTIMVDGGRSAGF
jgi:3-oxoacyl-[acyl-carrier protein] reductase